MFTKALAVSALALTLTMPTALLAAGSGQSPCPLRAYRIGNVTPYRPMEAAGKIMVPRLRGATLFVQAQPGLTAEWLRLSLSKEIADMKSGPAVADCPLGVDDVSVQVESAGPGFWIHIVAKNPAKADEVLRRAQLLAGHA